MKKLIIPIPDIKLDSIYNIDPEFLHESDISFLFLDLDNTMAPYSHPTPTIRLRNWVDKMKKAGIELFILSNNRGSRPKSFAEALNLDYMGRAKKPSAKKLLQLLKEKNIPHKNAAIVGDQIYTDVICGKRAGVMTIAVKPLELKNPLLAIRYGFEIPFRMINKRK